MSIEMQYKNLASDDEFRSKVEEKLWGTLQPIRDNRVGREERWKRHYRIFNCEFDNMSYKGMSKIYVAALRNAGETFVNTLARDIFPNNQWFKVEANLHNTSELQAEMLEALLLHFFTKNMNLKSDSLPQMRQLVMYGTAPTKIIWKDVEREIVAAELKRDDEDGWKRVFKKKTVKAFYGPYTRHCDLFNWFGWPETANSVEECEIVFEDMEVTVDHILSMSKTMVNKKKPDLGMMYYVPETDQEFSDASYARNLFQARQEKLKQMGISKDPSERWDKIGKNHRVLTEIYWKADLDDEGVKPWLITMVNDTKIIRLQENPFNDKEPPYLVPRYLRLIGELYGRGAYDSSDRLQYMANDIINQTMDSVQYRLNPITILDPTKVRFHQSIKRHPGARWLADPTGFLESAPIDVSATGFQAFNIAYGLIMDQSGAGAMLQGIPPVRGQGRMAHTASGASQMLGQQQMPLENVVEDFEEQYTTRLLKKSYNLMTQYMDQPILARVLGGDGTFLMKEVGVEDIVGDYQYKWMGVITARNKLVMGQQMLQFLNIIRSVPPQVMAGINWDYLIGRIWTDALGQRDSQEVFLKYKSQMTVDPDYEYDMLLADRDLTVYPADDDMAHMESHLKKRGKVKDQDKLDKWDKHIDDHMAQVNQKIQAQQQQQQQQQMQEAVMRAQAAKQISSASDSGGPQGQGQGPVPPGQGVQPQRNAPQNQPTGMGNNGAADMMRSTQGGAI